MRPENYITEYRTVLTEKNRIKENSKWENYVLALTLAVFYILLSLDTPLHGYGIMQNVEHLSGGRVRLAAGTLYGALATLTERGWIVSLGDESEGRKKEYQITPEGREAVRAELRRLHELTQNGDKLTSEWN